VRILSLDLSLTSVGWARRWGPGPKERDSGSFQPAGKGMQRIARIVEGIEDLAIMPGSAPPHLVVVEGYSYASRGRASVSLGELGGAVRWHLYLHSLEWVEVPPASRAMYATGKGNAGKDAVLAAAIRRMRYPGHDGDEVDALWLLELALGRYGMPEALQLPKSHRRAMGKIEWPNGDHLEGIKK
jgi:crossover junction endodeoxyribonuclease RuvC